MTHLEISAGLHLEIEAKCNMRKKQERNGMTKRHHSLKMNEWSH